MNEIQNDATAEGPAGSPGRAAAMNGEESMPPGVTCAWCGEIIKDGPGPVSHGMCPGCGTKFLAAMPGV